MRKKYRKKWTLGEFYKLWGVLALVSLVLCLVMGVFFFTGNGLDVVFNIGGKKYHEESSDVFPVYLYAGIFFAGLVAVNLLLMAGTKLRMRLQKTKGSTVVLKPRRR